MENDMFMIVKMKKEHLNQVLEISKIEFESTTWSQAQFEKEINNSYVCLFEGRVVAFLCLLLAHDEMTILNIAVENNFKRKRIASKLFEKAKEIAQKNNINTIFLEVETQNEPAISFYEKNGFEKMRVRNNYYKDGTSCLEMRLNLTQ